MRIFRLITAVAAITLVCVVSTPAKPWRSIVPLSSTRAAIERLLGPPAPGTRTVYNAGTETITVAYSDRPCAYDWRVPLDTVITLLVHPETPVKLADFKLVESKYDKRQGNHLENIYYYVNTAEGINFTVEEGLVTAIEYYPSSGDAHLKCSANQTRVAKPNAKSRQPSASVHGRKGKLTKSFSCPMHSDVVSSRPGVCRRCGMKLVERRSSTRENAGDPATAQGVPPAGSKTGKLPEPITTVGAKPWSSLSAKDRMLEMERLALSYEHTCLMHPEVHEAQPGVCPKCGMPLTTVKPSVTGAYQLVLTPEPQSPRPGEKVLLRFVISNPETGERVKDYVVNHEKLFHLFIVSNDLSEYQHVHPEKQADGTFSVETILPAAGGYKLHADFFPKGGTPQIIHRELRAGGDYPASRPGGPLLKPDAALLKSLDGMTITLEPGGPLIAGALISLNYHLSDSITGKPVGDLEPYLGAWGHTLILNADQSEYLHSHPSEILSASADRSELRGGPSVDFKAMFPAPGNYRIWTQFQRAGRVTTVFFTVRVL